MFTLVSLCSQSGVARAQPAANDGAAWQRNYAAARERLDAGAFVEAERAFERLAASAAREEDRRLALELADVSRALRARGVQLGRAPLALTTSEGAPLSDQRTTDELAWLYMGAVAYGLGTGAWLAVQTEANDAAPIVLPSLGFAGVAAGAVALADAQDLFRYGVPQSITSGLVLGLAEGVAWAMWNQSRVSYEDEWSEQTVATVVWGATTLGGIAGGVVGSVAGTTPGRASLVSSSGLWGGTLAGLTAAAISSNDADQRDDYALLAGAIGLNAGAVGGAFLAGPLSPSVARTRFIDLGGIAGGLLAGGLYISAADSLDDTSEGAERGFYATTALGIAAGLGASTFFTRNMAPDLGRAAASKAGTIAASPAILPTNGGGALGLTGTW